MKTVGIKFVLFPIYDCPFGGLIASLFNSAIIWSPASSDRKSQHYPIVISEAIDRFQFTVKDW